MPINIGGRDRVEPDVIEGEYCYC